MTISVNFLKLISPEPSSSNCFQIFCSKRFSKSSPVFIFRADLNSWRSIAPDPSPSKLTNARRIQPTRPSNFSAIFVRMRSIALSVLMLCILLVLDFAVLQKSSASSLDAISLRVLWKLDSGDRLRNPLSRVRLGLTNSGREKGRSGRSGWSSDGSLCFVGDGCRRMSCCCSKLAM